MQSKAKTVDQYYAELPADRRAALQQVRDVIRKNIDKGYVECMGYGMPGWAVPHSLYPPGYHCDPKQALPYCGLASQKQYMSLYLMCVYGDGGEDRAFRAAWAKTGKRLDMGKSCIRFKKVDDLALDVIADTIRRTPVKTYIAMYERSILSMNKAAAERAAARKTGMGAPGAKAANKVGKKAVVKKKAKAGAR